MLTVPLPSAEATEHLGACLARQIPAGYIIYLEGELGAGKTTLVRGFLRALGYQGPVRSPTYTLVEPYRVGDSSILHCDLYRLGDPAELEYLGLRDDLDGYTIWLIEWPERGRGMLPAADLTVQMLYAEAARLCRLSAVSARANALVDTIRCK